MNHALLEPRETAQKFDAYAQDYDRLIEDAVQLSGFDVQDLVLAKLRKLTALFPAWTSEPIRFLDYGCGAGNLLSLFHGFFPKAIYCGTDASAAMIEKARSRHPDRPVFFDTSDPKWQEHPKDLIFAAGVFHHIPPQERGPVLAELVRLLSPQGKIVIWEHNPHNPLTCKIVRDCSFDKDAVLIPPGRMKRLFRAHSLANIQIVFTTFFPKNLQILLPLERFLHWAPLGGQYVAIAERPESLPAP